MKRIRSRDIIEYMKCPKKAVLNKITEAWIEQAKLYLKLFPQAKKVLIVDEEGNVLEEVKNENTNRNK